MSEPNPYEPPRAELDVPAAPRRPAEGNTYDPRYNGAMGTALALAGAMLLLGALVLDGGTTLRWLLAATLCQCVVVLLVLARRPRSPTDADLAIVRYGILGLAAIFFLFRVMVL